MGWPVRVNKAPFFAAPIGLMSMRFLKAENRRASRETNEVVFQ